MVTAVDNSENQKLSSQDQTENGVVSSDFLADRVRQYGTPIMFKTSGHVADYVECRELKPLNENEMKSVYALLAYVAYNHNIKQDVVQHIVETKFGVASVDKLKQKDYEEVIRFLVDLRLDELN
ncbi:MAG: hypothetical protein PHX43_07230 [Alphaproteobacteria bacterium]|nr:hypothetical protein [Alphaproteobacteria bacterium]